jgi:acetoin utilization protein AcuC
VEPAVPVAGPSQPAGLPTFVWDERLAAYDFGPGHPLAPVRVELAVRLARDLGLLDPEAVREIAAPTATDAELFLVHDPEYVEIVRRLARDPRPGTGDPGHGLGTADDPVFAGMHEASAHVVGASLAAVRAVWSGQSMHGVNLAGGLHHAMRRSASGFCIYNDAAAAVRWALDAGAERVAYVDVDVHHGDGVERAFWDDPRVLTVSLHESPHTLFPGTGFPTDIGGLHAEGTAVNVALPPGTGDDGWLRAFDAVVPALLNAFGPSLLVTQHGCDSHFLDPLAHLTLTVDGQRASYAALHALAHEHAGGRWVALGGGGYEHVEVVPRAWAHLVGEIVHRPVDPTTAVPASWREYVLARLGRASPGRMTDGATPVLRRWSDGFDPDGDLLDRSVDATRRAVFPLHGLDAALDL